MNPETFKPIQVEFIGGPLCGRYMTLPSNASSRYTHYENPLNSLGYKVSGSVPEVTSDSLVRHTYIRDGNKQSNGCYPMRWVPPKAKA